MKRKQITAKELNERLLADPVWVAAEAERNRKFAELKAFYDHAEIPLVSELITSGVPVKSVWDLVNTKSPYPDAVPVLLDHLNRPYPERIREGIARALAVREARMGWTVLLHTFEEDRSESSIGVKWALALALGATATDAEFDDVVPLLRDRSNGENRVPLLAILGRSKNPRADQLLDELSNEPGIALDVAAVKRKREKRKLTKELRAKRKIR